MRDCVNCGRAVAVPRRGRCAPCAMYRITHGTERPPEMEIRRRERADHAATVGARTCLVCWSSPVVVIRGRCRRCYMYRYTHGFDRSPTHLEVSA